MIAAITSYEKKKLRLDGNDQQNLGDWVQTIAMEELLLEWGVSSERISRNERDPQVKACETVIVNGWNSFDGLETYDGFHMPDDRWKDVVYWGFNLEGTYIPEYAITELRKKEPIGCRDEGTMRRLNERNIECFVSGCVSALMKKRDKTECQRKVIIIDVSIDAEKVIPKCILDNCEHLTNSFQLKRVIGKKQMTLEESMSAYNRARDQLNYLRENARLVITGRLHVASPCVAMGIPVVLMKEDFDERFAWLDKLIPLYNKNKWDKIDWAPRSIDYENEKDMLKKYFKNRLLHQENSIAEYESVKRIFDIREKTEYNSVLKNGLNRVSDLIDKYCICGISLDTITFMDAVGCYQRGWRLTAVYDVNQKDFSFEGKKVQEILGNIDKKSVCFITTNKSRNIAIKHCLENQIPYVVVDYNNPEWDTHLYYD